MNVLNVVEILGTIAFAISGAMIAVRKQVDLFGVILLGMTTAVGGGITRDIMLGCTPPRIFQSLPVMGIAFVSSLGVFLVAYFFYDIYQRNQLIVDRVNNIFDALGLGLFTVMGMDIAAAEGNKRIIPLVFFGAVTGIGGGLLRDLMVNEIPFVLKKHIYAVASIAGGICYYIMQQYKILRNISVAVSIWVVVILRMLATKYHWNLPKANVKDSSSKFNFIKKRC